MALAKNVKKHIGKLTFLQELAILQAPEPNRFRSRLEAASAPIGSRAKPLFFTVKLHCQCNLTVKTQYPAECGNPHSTVPRFFTFKLHCQCDVTEKNRGAAECAEGLIQSAQGLVPTRRVRSSRTIFKK